MGRKNAIKKSARGDLIPTPGPLEQQIEGAQFVKSRSEKREKRKRKVGNEAGEYIPNSLSERIISEARKQVCDIDLEDESGTVEESKRMRHVSLGVSNEETSDAESFTCDDGYDDQVIELDPKDEADLQRFMTNKEGVARTLYDIIKTKIDAKTDDAGFALSVADPMEFNMRDLDPEIVEMYKEIGKVLSKYRSGKIPKAFKVIPKMVNWEQILYLTDPDGWSAAAMYQATRLFASNLNPRMCQRFYNLVLLPRIRDDIDEFKKLNFHLYQALCKAVYKPAAFFKGIILPLCETMACLLLLLRLFFIINTFKVKLFVETCINAAEWVISVILNKQMRCNVLGVALADNEFDFNSEVNCLTRYLDGPSSPDVRATPSLPVEVGELRTAVKNGIRKGLASI
ncbi:hypothetical protein RB195_010061 [Necator americanus]|uniref:Bystin n=1 Tax=Necator americanus TaxID=51031 RepID=A0ABR1CW79_NECAM